MYKRDFYSEKEWNQSNNQPNQHANFGTWMNSKRLWLCWKWEINLLQAVLRKCWATIKQKHVGVSIYLSVEWRKHLKECEWYWRTDCTTVRINLCFLFINSWAGRSDSRKIRVILYLFIAYVVIDGLRGLGQYKREKGQNKWTFNLFFCFYLSFRLIKMSGLSFLFHVL